MNLFKKYIIASLIVCLGINSEANNLTIDLNEIRSSNDSVFVELAVSWENSWTFESSDLNHDAVWVHCKALQNSNWSTVYPLSVLSDDFEIKESELNTGILLKPNPLSSGV